MSEWVRAQANETAFRQFGLRRGTLRHPPIGSHWPLLAHAVGVGSNPSGSAEGVYCMNRFRRCPESFYAGGPLSNPPFSGKMKK